jgi:hypothetical protein
LKQWESQFIKSERTLEEIREEILKEEPTLEVIQTLLERVRREVKGEEPGQEERLDKIADISNEIFRK